LNGAAAVLLVCGRLRDWRGNAILAAAFLALFISELLSAPFTFVFATPAYAVICAALILTRWPSPAEWAWKIAALALCLIFLFGSGVLDYYLGTIATSARTPAGGPAWDRLLSAHEWFRLFRDHSLCRFDARLLLCIEHRGGWLQIAALCGAALAIITRRGDMRTAAWALVAYVGLAHIYAYAYHAHWLGPASVLSSHFLILSCWSFICMFAVFPFFEAFHLFKLVSSADTRLSHRRQLASFIAIFALCILLIAVVVIMLRNPYGQLAVAAAAITALFLTVALLRAYRSKTLVIPAALDSAGAGPRSCRCFQFWHWFTCPWASVKRDHRLMTYRYSAICMTMHRSKSESRFAVMRPRFGSDSPRKPAAKTVRAGSTILSTAFGTP
jgi:hypothetical protein